LSRVTTLNADAWVADAAPVHLPLRKVFSVGLGNALEFYDFLTFSFFAIQIGHSFFPVARTSHGLLFTLATFGAGFITRPLGGFIIGRYADRVGRKPAMMLSFGLMGAAITGLALTPSYARIGAAAPILLLVFRLLQGFALGGEVGPSTAFLIEAAPPRRRGLYVGLQYGTQDAAVLAAGLVGFALSSWLSSADLDAWGWRLAFLLGAAIVPLGLVVRRSLPETLHRPETAARGVAAKLGGLASARILVLGLMILAGTSTSIYVIEYVATYAQDSLHMAANLAFLATVANGLFSMICDVGSGYVSDLVGRKRVMVTSVTLLILLTIPAYIVMVRWPSPLMVFGAVALLSAVLGFCAGPALVSITESLPKSGRSSAVGTLYAVALAIFGGSTQFMIKWLTDLSGSALAPAIYMTGALAIAAVAMVLIRETAPVRVGLG
jgi:MFS family permease